MEITNAYQEYLEKWLDGIKDEILFWDAFMKTEGKICNYPTNVWKEIIMDESDFVFDDCLEHSNTKFLDVGSGPFSRCGSRTSKYSIDFHAVDPLAIVYSILKEKYNIKPVIEPETAMVENLSSKFKENEFDIVHMSNSLDHCFDPILGLWQMLYVCKVGGKIILRHHANEAENENYQGFHQWNLLVEDGRFVIWREGIKYDIAEVFDGYAEIAQIKENVLENRGMKMWHYDQIVIQKLKDVPLHLNDNYPLLLEKILEKICILNYKFLNATQVNNSHIVIKFLGFKIKLRKKH